jgi:hypothetical protein
LPAIVHVRFIEAGIEVQYPLQSVRRVSFAFVNNWWEEQGGQRIVVVLGAQFVERCGLTIHTAAVDPSTRDWLLAKLRAATAKQWTARDGGYFTP